MRRPKAGTASRAGFDRHFGKPPEAELLNRLVMVSAGDSARAH